MGVGSLAKGLNMTAISKLVKLNFGGFGGEVGGAVGFGGDVGGAVGMEVHWTTSLVGGS
jgi:hypothetical protein